MATIIVSCLNSSFETTMVSSNHSSQYAMAIATVSLSSAAFFLNFVSLIVFLSLYRDRRTPETYSFALLSVCESTLNLFFTVTGILILANIFEHCQECIILTLGALGIANTAILIRNWWILGLSVVRCLLIVRPFTFGTVFTASYYKYSFIIVALISTILSAARLVFEFVPIYLQLYCVSPGFVRGLIRAHFVFQGAIPPAGVLVSTVILVYFLMCLGNRSSNFSHGKATLTTLLIALLFSCTEFPNMIMNLVYNFDTPPIADFLLIVDSTFNFFIYVVANRSFRMKLRSYGSSTAACADRLLRQCRRQDQSCQELAIVRRDKKMQKPLKQKCFTNFTETNGETTAHNEATNFIT